MESSSSSSSQSQPQPQEELAEQQRVDELRLEAELQQFRASPEGLSSAAALAKVFEVVDLWIQLYRLAKTDALLREVEPYCRQDVKGRPYLQYVQALAFCRWKQGRFRDALAGFEEMLSLVGPTASLCENIGHTYSSLGDLGKAEAYFKMALELAEREAKAAEQDTSLRVPERNTGGVLLGLGIIKDRQGHPAEALPILLDALAWYEAKFHGRGLSSLVAKAHTSVAKAYEQLSPPSPPPPAQQQHLEQAEAHYRDALRIFIVTCGEDSPLTASALASLGKLLLREGYTTASRQQEGLSLLTRALDLESRKDSLHLMSVYELMVKILEVQTTSCCGKSGEKRLDRGAFRAYLPSIRAAEQNLQKQGFAEDGNLAAFLKSGGEFAVIAGEYAEGIRMLTKAVKLFEQVTEMDVSQLIRSTKGLLAYAQSEFQG